jgi:outer membrane protein TolC
VDLPLPVNLATALRLADGRPLVVAAAQATAWVAEAQLQRAKLIWVPELQLSSVYYRHDGVGPDFFRGVNTLQAPISQWINYSYTGGGLNQVFNLTEAIFQPLAARQVLDARRHDIQAAKNDALLMTANAYFNVHKYRGTYAGALEVVGRAKELVARFKSLSKDLIPTVEVDRAKTLLADLEQHAASSREEWRVASADLTQMLRLDPRAVVIPLEPDYLQITLVDPARPLDELMPIALRNRPEIAAQLALIQAALVRIREEKMRPLLPRVLVTGFQTPGGMKQQFGLFGTGAGNQLNNWSFRDDISLQLIWQLEALGFGNLARVKEQRGQQSAAVVELNNIQDGVVREVTEAQARLQSAAVRVQQTERGLRESLITFEGNFKGLEQTKRFNDVLIQIYRPQEVVRALERLRVNYDSYFAAVYDYNRSQFEMFHAMGYPARELSILRPPGEILPLATERPDYMPKVQEGPPPATR